MFTYPAPTRGLAGREVLAGWPGLPWPARRPVEMWGWGAANRLSTGLPVGRQGNCRPTLALNTKADEDVKLKTPSNGRHFRHRFAAHGTEKGG